MQQRGLNVMLLTNEPIRQIQLVAIGGSIGTGLFIAIGTGLYKGGPGSLLLAFIIQSLMVGMLNSCLAEMTTYISVSGGFIRLAGYWFDEAWGFMAGWNFFIYMAHTVRFEISAVNILLEYWRHDIPVVAVCLACIAAFTHQLALPLVPYGEAEFWLSDSRVILLFILFSFIFVTIVGGNPQGDTYGFRHWQNPGTFAGYIAVFTCAWPEYISTVAAAVKYPCIYIKSAFKNVYWQFNIFFVRGALCVGTLIAYNDSTLVAALESGELSAAVSPYIIAIQNLGIDVIPYIISALIVTTVFPANNTYNYTATRVLYGAAVFQSITLLCVMQNVCKAQDFDRFKLPYTGLFQPYLMSTANCFLGFIMLLLAPIAFLGWKIYKGTRWLRPHEGVETEQPIGVWREMVRLRDIRRLCSRKSTGDQV
ncbi:amino acid permease-domain-containing protein [Aspergillus caelatus]|uniref:Amino acid permease-domain-containing protein n=1 Tax=Aspergillus caelatus TaxID=61420 RepID=A0A5N7ACS0_9EURO|nr:amino acid permease-domain-containing protein [Aspergillus caelatus]KAE8367654.1 amino acid permease-domain-containing protein [Aspergillus caelatus]